MPMGILTRLVSTSQRLHSEGKKSEELIVDVFGELVDIES